MPSKGTQSEFVKAVKNASSKPINVTDEGIFNATVADMPKNSANELPRYQAGDSFIPYGQTFQHNSRVFNDYLDTVAQKYALVFIKNALAQNPLTYFKRGEVPYGGKIESVVMNILAPKMFRQDLVDGPESPYAINNGEVLGQTYTQTEDIEQSNTIADTQDTMFFQNLKQFNDFVFGKMAALVNGALLDEYFQTKLTLAKALADNQMKVTEATDIKDLASKILLWTKKLRYFTNQANAVNFTQATRVEDIVVLVPLKYNVQLNTDYFANVFNAELVQETNVHYLEVDEFPDVWTYDKAHEVVQEDITGGFVDPREHPLGTTIPVGAVARPNATDATQKVDGDSIGAIILDRDALQLWDAMPLTLSTIQNPKKRYTNLFMNKKTYLMYVQALNAMCIKVKDGATALDDTQTFTNSELLRLQATTTDNAVKAVKDSKSKK